MEIIWADSASEHGIPQPQVLYALAHAEADAILPGYEDEVTRVFVGHPNEMDAYYLEVIVAHRPTRYLRIFHANYLTDKFRYLVERSEDEFTRS